MLVMTAVGFIPKQPELTRFPSGSQKVTFEVCDKRRTKEGNEWIEVTESAEFFSWGDEAERLAELLRPGLSVTALGYQETSKWVDAAGVKHSKRIYRLVDVQLDRNRRSDAVSSDSQDAEQQSAGKSRGNNRRSENTDRPATPRQQSRRTERPVPALVPSAASNSPSANFDNDGMVY